MPQAQVTIELRDDNEKPQPHDTIVVSYPHERFDAMMTKMLAKIKQTFH